MGHTTFELNYSYKQRVFYEENIDPYFKSRSTDKVIIVLHKLMSLYRKNLTHV